MGSTNAAEVSSIRSFLFWRFHCVCAAVSVRQGHDNECGLAGLYVGCSKRA